jgi:cytoskeletal protein CcmA (bactofilin family)
MWRRNRRDRTAPKPDDLSAFLDESAEIQGTFTFSGTVMLNGKLHGEVRTPDTLIVGDKAVLNANIRAGTVMIHGEVVGNVVATERVELRGRARVFGDVEAPVVVVDEGVVFEGHCRMTRPGSPEPDAGTPAPAA